MKKFLTWIIAFALAVVTVIPATAQPSNAAFKQRTAMPEYSSAEGKAYYYTDNNVFYKYNLGPNRKYLSGYKGYCTGNCTWYAYARASEILGKPLNSNFRWSASKWWSTNKEGNYYPYGSTPKVGAIACYSTHVAIVEEVVNGKPKVSESGWRISKTKPAKASAIRFHYGTPWQNDIKGYIYITDTAESTAKDVSYSVKITAKNLNLRTGPGTSYGRVGYAKKGTYKISKESGNWGMLADSGYWVCLSYVTKVAQTTPSQPAAPSQPSTDTTVSTIPSQPSAGTTATKPASPADNSYKVKVKAKDLNMRTGAGTNYKRKGYIKPGTYTITKEKNGWGYVKEKGYWISLKYTTKVKESSSSSSTVTSSTSGAYKVKVKAKDLNMRTGPGTNYKRKGYIKPGTHTITQTKNGWGKVKSNGYWIKLSYTTKL